MAVFRFLLLACVLVMVRTNVTDMDSARDHILKYSVSAEYLEDNPALGSLTQDDQMAKVFSSYQQFFGLDITGHLDQATMEMMNRPRCGLQDFLVPGDDMKRRKKRYVVQGGKWNGNNLSYKITGYTGDLGEPTQDTIFRQAFKMWSDVTPLTFTQVFNNAAADIIVFFAAGAHNDDSAFDGPSGTLAHAYFPTSHPIGGDAHFDNDESWTDQTNSGINLLQVAVHEIGHSLGLSHSSVRGAIMFPSYSGYVSEFALHSDDIAGIQFIYGGPTTTGSTSTTTPTPTTTTTTRPTPTPTTRTTPRPTARPTSRTTPTTTRSTSTTDATTTFPTPVSNLRQQFCTNIRFDAITKFGDKTYAFKDDIYSVINQNGIADGYPRYIADDWQGAPSNIDAALYWPENRPPRVYLFKGNQYWRYELDVDGSPKLRAGYPNTIRNGFSGLDDNIDNAFVWGRNGRTYINKGGNYYRLFKDTVSNTTRGIADSGYPRNNAAWRLPEQSYDSIFQWDNGRTYLFKGDQYIRYDDFRLGVDKNANPPYPRPINQWWISCSAEDLTAEMKEEENEFNVFDTIDSATSAGGDSSPESTTLSDMTGSATVIRQGALLLFVAALLARFV